MSVLVRSMTKDKKSCKGEKVCYCDFVAALVPGKIYSGEFFHGKQLSYFRIEGAEGVRQ